MDSRSACVAVLAPNGEPRAAVEACRPLGAPVVFLCFHETVQWWKQGASAAEWIESIPSDRIDGFFQSHKQDFSPEAVYRAKTLGRVRTEYQLAFVDVGLMPLVEEEARRGPEPPYRKKRGWNQKPARLGGCDRRARPLAAQVRVPAALGKIPSATSKFRTSRILSSPMSRPYSSESRTTTAQPPSVRDRSKGRKLWRIGGQASTGSAAWHSRRRSR